MPLKMPLRLLNLHMYFCTNIHKMTSGSVHFVDLPFFGAIRLLYFSRLFIVKIS
jgi:hypothetical protein